MPDVTAPGTVDGVEPSILVNLLDIKDNPARVKVFTADDGTDRYLTKTGDPVLVTPKDLSVLGVVAYEIIDPSEEPAPEEPPAPDSPAENPPVVEETVKIPPLNPGQV